MQEWENNIDSLPFSEENFQLLKEQNKKLSSEFKSQNDLLCKKIEQLEKKIIWFEEQFKIGQQRAFGKKSEKHPDQMMLPIFDNDNEASDEVEVEVKQETITYSRRKPKSCGRKIDTSLLPREQEVHDIAAEEKYCSCCGEELVKLGEDISEQLELIPAILKVIEHIILKYVCKKCGVIKQGKKPESVIPKSMAAPSLITEVVIKKYQHHQPLYRQSKIFRQEGLDIPDNTLGNWVMKAGECLEPLGTALWKEIENTKTLQADETPVKVLSKDKKGYIWGYHGYDPGNKFVIFDYANGRGSEFVNKRLVNYRGILQTDGYAGYNSLRARSDVIGIGCWAHSRRKYMEIVKTTKITGKAHQAISFITKLYNLEKEAKNLDFSERKKLRQTKAKPILDKFKLWLDKSISKSPPQSAIGKALSYTLKQWPYLYEYINHGEVEIDNNLMENQIRPFALGRKNWLFLGNEASAAIGARYYSLIQTCLLNWINPRHYLNYIFTQVHKIRKGEIDPKSLLPQYIDQTLLN